MEGRRKEEREGWRLEGREGKYQMVRALQGVSIE